MTRFKSFSPILIGVASACAVLALGLSPRVHAVASALVTVVNTSANPVTVASVDDRVAQPAGFRVYPNIRAFASSVVPAGKRLVITGVSGWNNGNGSASGIEIVVFFNNLGSTQTIPFGAPQSATSMRYLMNENVFLVADAGSTVYFTVDDSDYNDTAGINIDVHGYYVSAS